MPIPRITSSQSMFKVVARDTNSITISRSGKNSPTLKILTFPENEIKELQKIAEKIYERKRLARTVNTGIENKKSLKDWLLKLFKQN